MALKRQYLSVKIWLIIYILCAWLATFLYRIKQKLFGFYRPIQHCFMWHFVLKRLRRLEQIRQPVWSLQFQYLEVYTRTHTHMMSSCQHVINNTLAGRRHNGYIYSGCSGSDLPATIQFRLIRASPLLPSKRTDSSLYTYVNISYCIRQRLISTAWEDCVGNK